MKIRILSLAMAIAGMTVYAVQAAPSVADIERMGKDLTPIGAEKAGNKDNSIPSWGGTTDKPQGAWSWGKYRGDFSKPKDEKPLFVIDASNADKYADKLSPGQLAMLKQMKGYRMDVYPTRRTCGIPDFVAENTKKNVATAKLAADGWGLKEAVVPGIPLPLPENGIQGMWNSKLRYRGVGMDYPNTVTTLSPRKGSSEWIRAGQEFTAYYPWGAKGSNLLY